MGLDVILNRNGQMLEWKDAVMQSFPFQIAEEKYPIWGDPSMGQENDVVEYGRQQYVAEITGMSVVPGAVSFRGRGYSAFLNAAGYEHDFYSNFSPEQIKDLARWFQKILEPYAGQDEMIEVHEEPLRALRWFYHLLSWMAEHNIGTVADF